MYYGTEILSAAGFSERTSLICNVLNGVFSVGGMLIGVLFLVDRFKRKTIIIYGFAIMATLHLIIAAVDYTGGRSESHRHLAAGRAVRRCDAGFHGLYYGWY